MTNQASHNPTRPIIPFDLFSATIRQNLARLAHELQSPVYLVGGTVRDLLMNRKPTDIDLTVADRAYQWAQRLARRTGGVFVELSREEGAARVVWPDLQIDFADFRRNSRNIEEDLAKRDITINSMAIPLQPAGDKQPAVIDPLGGMRDIREKSIRVTSQNAFHDDPLRLLRVFRFAATLNFSIDESTLHLVSKHKNLIAASASERIAHELELIMESDRAHFAFDLLARSGPLFEIIPELQAGVGMAQPASHQFDVFDHSQACLFYMEKIQSAIENHFPQNASVITDYLSDRHCGPTLKWAALLHDIGKPPTRGINHAKGGRLTFYNHDEVGGRICRDLGARLRWSNKKTGTVAKLVAAHMRPFHLCNVQRHDNISLKACLRLIRKLGPHLVGVFLLAMADALAGKGEESPPQMREELRGLFKQVQEVYRENVIPAQTGPPLLTGKDLIEDLGLAPGPIFAKILDLVAQARMEKKISTREQALALAASLAKNRY